MNALTRLAAMPGQRRLAGSLAAVAIAMVISACGSSSSDSTIPTDNSSSLISRLNGVQSAIDNQQCQLAEQRAKEFLAGVDQLPDSVTPEDKEKLRKAGENLQQLATEPDQCKPVETGTSGLTGTEPTTSSTTTSSIPPPETTETTTSSTTSTTTQSQPPTDGGGEEGNGGAPPPSTGGGGETG